MEWVVAVVSLAVEDRREVFELGEDMADEAEDGELGIEPVLLLEAVLVSGDVRRLCRLESCWFRSFMKQLDKWVLRFTVLGDVDCCCGVVSC